VDCTGYGDLAAYAGAAYTEPNDYPVANSIGVGGVSVEGYYQFLNDHGAISEYARGTRSGRPGRIVRLNANMSKLPTEFAQAARAIGMSPTTTTIHDDYLMFIKLNYKMDVSPTNRDALAQAELELRKRQARAIELFRQYVPGCERAFIARTSPSVCIRRADQANSGRRGRLIACDYDLTRSDVLEGRHFEDDVMAYGFHDSARRLLSAWSAPRLQIKDGGTYGIPYRALLPAGLENLLVAGMMITAPTRSEVDGAPTTTPTCPRETPSRAWGRGRRRARLRRSVRRGAAERATSHTRPCVRHW